MEIQLNLQLEQIEEIYVSSDNPLTNEQLYKALSEKTNITLAQINHTTPVGKNQAPVSLIKRKVRWYQQTLKHLGVLKKVAGKKGVWELATRNKKGLYEANNIKLVAFSTSLGVAIWGNNSSVFTGMNEPIHLCITSPPYPLKSQRSYGNVSESEWVDFITRSLEPIVCSLIPGGSIVLNVSNDIFDSGRPSRSLYLEKMVLSLHERLGLHLMDRIPWANLSKPPNPTFWACVNRVQLCVGWEPIYWFSNDPTKVRSDNRRVLEPHTEKHKQLIADGGDKRIITYGDGAYSLRGQGKSFSNKTQGKIPKNVIFKGHRCADTLKLREIANELNLPAHPATFPTYIPEMFIRFLTNEGELVVDPFCGWNKTGLAAERNNRRWLSCDLVLDYLAVQANLFKNFQGFKSYSNIMNRVII